jgi:hypothetical protein
VSLPNVSVWPGGPLRGAECNDRCRGRADVVPSRAGKDGTEFVAAVGKKGRYRPKPTTRDQAPFLPVKRFHLALELDQYGMALAVNCLAGGHFDPPFADAVFLRVLALVVVQADADFVLEHGGYVVGAARVRGQTVGQWRAVEGVGHGEPWILESDDLYKLCCRMLAAHSVSALGRVSASSGFVARMTRSSCSAIVLRASTCTVSMSKLAPAISATIASAVPT